MKTNPLLCAVILISTCLSGASLSATRVDAQSPARSDNQEHRDSQKPQSSAARIRVAQGEYKTYSRASDGGIGPFDPALHDFAETWILWKLSDGSMQVEGDRTYEAPQYESHRDGFAVLLSRQFTIARVTEYKKLRWRPDSGPLTCNFAPNLLTCDSGAHDPSQKVSLRLPLTSPYGFLWPISAYSMTNITRFVHRIRGEAIPVSMLTIDEPSPANPVMASVLEGKLDYLGQEQIVVAGKKWQADKFELKVALHAPFMIWTSPQGLLLDFTEENNANRLTERGMKLVHYEQFADF